MLGVDYLATKLVMCIINIMNSFLEDCAKFNAYDSFKVVLNL